MNYLVKFCLFAALICLAAANNDSSTPQDDPSKQDAYESNIVQKGVRKVLGAVVSPFSWVCGFVKNKVGIKAAVGAGLGITGALGYGASLFLPKWAMLSVGGALAATTVVSGYTAYKLFADPEQFAKDLKGNSFNSWATQFVVSTVGLACGYEANAEFKLLVDGVALAKRVTMIKINKHNPKNSKEDNANLAKDLASSKKKLRKEVCPQILDKMKRATTNSSFVGMFVKLACSASSDFSDEDANKLIREHLSAKVVEAALSSIAFVTCMGELKKYPQALQQKMMLSLAGDKAAFLGVMNRISAMRRRRETKALRKKLSAKKSIQVPVEQLAAGEAAPATKVEDLQQRQTSQHRGTTNSYVLLVMLGVIAALLAGVYFLLKSLGNPASSEYPNQLTHQVNHRKSEFVDLEAQWGKP